MALDDEQRRRVEDAYVAEVRPVLFDGPRARSGPPVAVLWNHPPWPSHGPALHELNDDYGGDLVILDAQELRGSLPDYGGYIAQPLTAQSASQEDVSYLMELAKDDARARGVSVLVPGTGTRRHVTMGTAEDFYQNGYHVELVVVAEPIEATRLRAIDEYLNGDVNVWPRPNNRAANWDGLPQTVEAAEASRHVHRVEIRTVDGTVLYDSADPASYQAANARAALEEGRQLNLSPAETRQWLAQWQQSMQRAVNSPKLGELDSDDYDKVAPVLRDSARDAKKVAERVAPPGSPEQQTAIAQVSATTQQPRIRRALVRPLIIDLRHARAQADQQLTRAAASYDRHAIEGPIRAAPTSSVNSQVAKAVSAAFDGIETVLGEIEGEIFNAFTERIIWLEGLIDGGGRSGP